MTLRDNQIYCVFDTSAAVVNKFRVWGIFATIFVIAKTMPE